MTDVYVHAIDPFAWQISGNFGIRWYGLAYLGGFISGYWIVLQLIKRGRTSMTAEKLADFTTFVAIGTLVGGRLGYCLFYKPELFFDFDSEMPFWGVLKVHEGGMASHGGIAGIMLVCWLYARHQGFSFLHIMDLTCFGGALGIFFGRIANFINGELYGRAASESLAWAVKFPQEMYLWLHHISAKTPGRVEWATEKLKSLGPAVEKLNAAGQTTLGPMKIDSEQWQNWITSFAGLQNRIYDTIDQLVGAVQMGNAEITQGLAQVLTTRHPSQLYQALMEGLLVFFVITLVWIKPRKPGLISAVFGLTYALARIAGEQFRMPDAHLGYQWLGLTRGQWISIGMVAVSLILLTYVLQSKSKKVGGWSKASNP